MTLSKNKYANGGASLMKNDFCFDSKDGVTKIWVTEWVPDGEVKAVLQICHGMCEYIGRYEPFAEYMCGKGFYVVGNDHLGHGRSVTGDDKLGFFAEENGNAILLSDLETLRKLTKERYPSVPYFWLGHSMGSFLTRQYIADHGKELTAAVIMGTGTTPPPVLTIGKNLCKAIAKKKGWDHRSETVDNIAFGSYNKRIKPLRTEGDWLTKDEAIVDKYINDPWCTYMFTVNGFYNMFYSIGECQKKKTAERIPKTLPLLITSGQEDPVGGYGAGVEKAYETYKSVGMKDVTLKLYPGDRHEILNELDRAQVYDDLYNWYISKIKA